MGYNNYQLGTIYFKNKDFKTALKYFEDSAAAEPHFKTYEMMYLCSVNLGDNDGSKEYLKKAYELNKNNDKVGVEYAKLVLEEGNKEISLEILKQILQRNNTYDPAKKILDCMNKE